MNYLVDQIELTVGIPGLGPRYPARNPPTVINQGGIRMNNITIDRSNIGVLNTGSIGAIDHAIGTMTSSGHDASADLFKAMTEAIAKNSEADVTLKNKLLELLSVLSSEATKPKEQRKNVAMLALVKEFASLCNGAATLVRALGQYLPALTGMFS